LPKEGVVSNDDAPIQGIPRTEAMRLLSDALDVVEGRATAANDRQDARTEDLANAVETIAREPAAYELGARAVEAHVQQGVVNPE
jgi:hypothetical protein